MTVELFAIAIPVVDRKAKVFEAGCQQTYSQSCWGAEACFLFRIFWYCILWLFVQVFWEKIPCTIALRVKGIITFKYKCKGGELLTRVQPSKSYKDVEDALVDKAVLAHLQDGCVFTFLDRIWVRILQQIIEFQLELRRYNFDRCSFSFILLLRLDSRGELRICAEDNALVGRINYEIRSCN